MGRAQSHHPIPDSCPERGAAMTLSGTASAVQPGHLNPWLPWLMDEYRKRELSRPPVGRRGDGPQSSFRHLFNIRGVRRWQELRVPTP